MIRGIIFDLDGTLLNSKALRIKAWKHAFEIFGVNIPEEQISPLIGLPGVDLAGKFSSRAFEIEMEEERYFKSHLEEMSLYGDVDHTFSKLSELNVKTSIVTSSRRALMEILKLPYRPVVTIDDVGVGKPDPEAYLKALSLLDVKASECLVVGDAETDLIPAKDIGSVSVYIGHGNRRFSNYADYYIDEVSEVLEIVRKLNS
ncbi:MAG: HAD-IA family hydrolase [Candidatus Thermoplasmatota archaeon]|jgi:HAD superfamily hydrolase (TIGR01509 family)|nr:HAD-IA family hydrolase [Candidatus Thermoplasmatota archaeon]